MPVDRNATLRKAEKLLRQGRLEAAIAEYGALVQDQPSDWSTTNLLGDLYVRAGQIDNAVAQFTRVADHLSMEGFLPKAAAVYRKILKIKADDEHALWQFAEVCARQGLLADAKVAMAALAARRKARGDHEGTAAAHIRLSELDPTDLDARVTAARARGETGDPGAAAAQLRQAAAELRDRGRPNEAAELLREADQVVPAPAPDDHAAEVVLPGATLDAADAGSPPRGLDADATQVAESDPNAMWAFAEQALHSGRTAEGTAMLDRLLAADPSRRSAVATLGRSVAQSDVAAGFRCVEMATQAAIAEDDWIWTVKALDEFAVQAPNYIPALLRLVEVCVDGGLETEMYAAQGRLADAYLHAGSGAEALVIAEDLMAREPWNLENVKRFRRVMAFLGEPEPDPIIAERLGGQTPFTSTNRTAPEPQIDAAPSVPSLAAIIPSARGPHESTLRIAATEGTATVEPVPPAARPSHEIDLSAVLDELKAGQPTPVAPPAPPDASASASGPIFQDLRGGGEISPERAGEYLKTAAAYLEIGGVEEAIKMLAAAARSPRLRFKAAGKLARLYRERGALAEAVEWFELAVEAPSPDPETSHALLYDLATTLEALGETARALAVLLELRNDAGNYRDLEARIENLAKVQMRS